MAPADTVEIIHPKPVPHPGRWISAGIVTVLAAMIVNGLVTNPNYHWPVVWQYLFDPAIVRGVGYTLLLTVISMVIGIALAISMAIMRQSPNSIMRGVSCFYIWFFRGTPIYTQLLFWGLIPTLYQHLSLGIPFGPEFFKFETATVITAFWSAALGLGLNEGAYLAEIVRSGLNSVNNGQWEAATALGMRRSQILKRIIIPQSMRVIVPPTGNETISMLKTTSLVVAVPYTLELTYAAGVIGNRTFLPVPLLIVAAIWYLCITSILMIGQHYLELYYGKGFAKNSASSAMPTSRSKRRKLMQRQQAIIASDTTTDDPFIGVTP